MRRSLLLGAILALALGLRLWNVQTSPGWYTDEGAHLSIAGSLLAGRTQYLAVTGSTLLFSRLPLFEWLLAGALWLTGAGPADPIGMLALRVLTGSLGVATTALLYFVASRLNRSPAVSLLSALAYAIHPQAVVYSRFGFSYNLLAPLMLLALWGAGEYLARDPRHNPRASARWLALAALAIGLGAVSDFWMWAMAVPLGTAIALGRPRDALWALPLLVLPFALYVSGMLLSAPAAFLADLAFAAGRLRGADPAAQLSLLAENLWTLLSQDAWLALGLVGLFALKPPRLRALALLWFWAPFVLIGRTVPMFSLSYYYLIPLLPLAMLGLAAGLHRLWLAARTLAHRHPMLGLASRLAIVLVASIAVVQAIRLDFESALGYRAPEIAHVLVAPADAQTAAQFVNARAAPGNLTIASPAIAWLIGGNAADFQMSLAYTGHATPHIPATLPRERYAFDPSFEQARFVVVDGLWRTWGVTNVGGLADALDELERGWKLVWQAGVVSVYERPEGR
jgi:hypothetical protein